MGPRAGLCLAVLWACSARPGGGERLDTDEAVTGASPSSASPPGVGASPTSSAEGSPLGPPQPPPELRSVDSGHHVVLPLGGACPAGTLPSERVQCTDVPYCACEYVCSPGCGPDEVCAPGAADDPPACACHGALEATESGCVWRGLVADPSFDDPTAWGFNAQSTTNAARAEVSDGRLELRITQRCSYAWGGTVARLPARAQMPDGAALVFDYTATSDVEDADPDIAFQLDEANGGTPLDRSGRPAVMRTCVALHDAPWLSVLGFQVQAFGACAPPVDIGISIDNVRLEADPSCG